LQVDIIEVDKAKVSIEAALKSYSWELSFASLIVPLLYNIYNPEVEAKQKEIKALQGNIGPRRKKFL
jgi:hypothetical protein